MGIKNSVCRGCGAPIVWIPTQAGKAMPCDPDLLTYWAKRGGTKKIVTPNGEVISAELEGPLEKATGVGYTSHFATCPKSSDFRRR